MLYYFARRKAVGAITVAVDEDIAVGISFKKHPKAVFSSGLQKWLDAYFTGGRPRFPFKTSLKGTPFQLKVWRAISGIKFGHVRSYGEIAKIIGYPKAVRAVGGACGANPLPLLIPCHRVVAKSGLGGFSGGLNIKKRLLALERGGKKG